MNCPMEAGGNPDLLLDYAAGKLKPDVRMEIERHLESCPACFEIAGGQQAVWQALDNWEPADVSLDFDRRLYARIDQDVSWFQRLMRPFHPLLRHSVPIAATAGVMIMAGLLLYRPAGVPAPPPATQAVQAENLQPDQLQSALEDMEMLRQFNQLVPDNDGPKM